MCLCFVWQQIGSTVLFALELALPPGLTLAISNSLIKHEHTIFCKTIETRDIYQIHECYDCYYNKKNTHTHIFWIKMCLKRGRQQRCDGNITISTCENLTDVPTHRDFVTIVIGPVVFVCDCERERERQSIIWIFDKDHALFLLLFIFPFHFVARFVCWIRSCVFDEH